MHYILLAWLVIDICIDIYLLHTYVFYFLQSLFIFYVASYLLGQHLLLQEMLVMFIPEHSLPPQLGLGWVHVRC